MAKKSKASFLKAIFTSAESSKETCDKYDTANKKLHEVVWAAFVGLVTDGKVNMTTDKYHGDSAVKAEIDELGKDIVVQIIEGGYSEQHAKNELAKALRANGLERRKVADKPEPSSDNADAEGADEVDTLEVNTQATNEEKLANLAISITGGNVKEAANLANRAYKMLKKQADAV